MGRGAAAEAGSRPREFAGRLPQPTGVTLAGNGGYEDDFFASLRAGAIWYLVRETDGERLREALADALADGAPIRRTFVTSPRRRVPGRRAPGPGAGVTGAGTRLTSREWQVLELLRSKAEME